MKKGVDYTISGIAESSFIDDLPTLVSIILAFFLFFMLMGARGGAGGMNQRLANFGKSRARLSSDVNVKFSDVAGMEEERRSFGRWSSSSDTPSSLAPWAPGYPRASYL